MKRKLIKQDAFDQIIKESAVSVARELTEAEGIVARALGKDHISLRSFNDATCLFETLDNSYIHASYELDENNVTFNNIEELVIDEDSRTQKRRAMIGEMIDALLEKDGEAKAKALFDQCVEMVNWTAAKKCAAELSGCEDDEKGKAFPSKKMPFNMKGKAKRTRDKNDEKPFGEKKKGEDEKKDFFKKAKAAGKPVEEMYAIANNVLEYAEYLRIGPALKESIAKQDEKGNIVALKVPVTTVRNEGKVLELGYKTLESKCKSLREAAAGLAENQDFCKAMAELKRQNAFQDADSLEDVLEAVVKTWPQVLYVSEAELSTIIGQALSTANVNNYDDQTCAFMAEGILRKAHGAYTDRVNQIMHLARAPKMEENADAYEHFQKVVESFFSQIDEQFGIERQIFADLYEALEYLYGRADRRGDDTLKRETAGYLNELAAILNDQVRPDIAVAEEAAQWLSNIIETNLESGTWNVSNKPHITLNGDHPDMAKKASHGYKPSADASGDWGDPAPMIKQDDMSYKGNAPEEARGRSWGNVGGGDIFPSLKNPYIPKPFGDYTMKGEKGVDKDTFGQHHGSWQSSDTWPALQNPYVPKEAGGVGGKGHKMKDGKETDLVVDK